MYRLTAAMGEGSFMGKWLVEFFLVFVGYTAVFTFTLGFIVPLQKIMLPENSLLASVLFLPHGVRAIAFFLFGLKAALYLLPAHYAMWYISVHGADIGLDLFAPLVSILGCVIGYLVFLSIRNFLPDKFYLVKCFLCLKKVSNRLNSLKR